MDDAQKRLEARKARLDEARKKRVNNLKRPGGGGPDGSEDSLSPSLGSSSSASAALSPSSSLAPTLVSSFSPPSLSRPPSSAAATGRPSPSATSHAPFKSSSSSFASPGGPAPSRTPASGVSGPFAGSSARPAPVLGSSSSFSGTNGFAKPLPPSARARPVGAGSPSSGSPLGSPSPSPPPVKRTGAAPGGPSFSPSSLVSSQPAAGRLGATSPAAATAPLRSPSASSPSPSPVPAPSVSSPTLVRPGLSTTAGGFRGGFAAQAPGSPSVNRAYGSPTLPAHASPLVSRPAVPQSSPGDELRKKREAEEAQRQRVVAEEEKKRTEERRRAEEAQKKEAEEEQKKNRWDEERRAWDEAEHKRQAEAVQEQRKREEERARGQQQETTQQANVDQQKEKEEKRLHYIGLFVEMQKKEREQTKARRADAKEARQLRSPQPVAPLPAASTLPAPARPTPSPSSTTTQPTPTPPSKPQQLPAAGLAVGTPFAQETDMDREIRMIIEIGQLKEEVDAYKRKCKEEEAQVAALKKQIQRRAEAQTEAEARKKRAGWLASSSNSGGSAIHKDRTPVVSVYQTKDVTKRPLVGGARFFSVYTPAGGSPIDGYDPSEERTRSPSLPQAGPPPTPAPTPVSPPPAAVSPSSSAVPLDEASDSGRGKLKRSKSGKILRSFLSTYIPSASSPSSPSSAGSSLASSGEKATRLGSSSSSFDDAGVPSTSANKGSLIKKRELRKSFSLEAGQLIRKKKEADDSGTSDEKKKEKERLKQEKKEKKERERKEKELKKKRGGKPVTVFNSTLEEVMSLQDESAGDVPVILTTLTDAIFSLNGHQCEGIFRLSPSIAEVSKLKDQFNAQNYQLTTSDPHVVASCLKLWFRELSQPLIPHNFYDECIKKAHHTEQITQLITRIPPINQKVIEFFAQFLLKLAATENVSVTKMGLDNLAIVFSPGFLRCLDPMKMMANSALEGLFVENLIEIYQAS